MATGCSLLFNWSNVFLQKWPVCDCHPAVLQNVNSVPAAHRFDGNVCLSNLLLQHRTRAGWYVEYLQYLEAIFLNDVNYKEQL